MRRDSRLSGVLHVLLHLAQREGPSTSETLAKVMDTNPVVLRRIMAGLRDRGYVQSSKGHGGGWTLSCDIAAITLGDVYDALGRPPLLSLRHRSEHPDCVVEAAVNDALGDVFDEVEALLLARFEDITLSALDEEVRRRLTPKQAARRRGSRNSEHEQGACTRDEP
ncbi:RrF2 family transcriptional regulator [Haliangium ochraceum]|uniref:Transcriptional regulator, BadM/Rrf2 family n=1 Tax=Haliangium ochraceum (strain DSM 14365 / JCM 11303 / SMP-2) TaxID=502025 RepID=D0LMM3_HALO1|nr:Rrf2 family transcriptional regulator [Haliangium ochraceum]ACY18710.1 transcriptional regulator, BadM/Rrf2 family [Haliangium ochraceum DSM 14365]